MVILFLMLLLTMLMPRKEYETVQECDQAEVRTVLTDQYELVEGNMYIDLYRRK